MTRTTVTMVCVFALLAAVLSFGQGRTVATANIPFAFSVEGRTLPAGQYQFIRDANADTMSILGPTKAASALVPVLTRLAGGIHTTPQDAHIVFDVLGDVHTLSEVWASGDDGYLVHITKEQHQHRIVNAPK